MHCLAHPKRGKKGLQYAQFRKVDSVVLPTPGAVDQKYRGPYWISLLRQESGDRKSIREAS